MYRLIYVYVCNDNKGKRLWIWEGEGICKALEGIEGWGNDVNTVHTHTHIILKIKYKDK